MKEYANQRLAELQDEVQVFNEMGIAPVKKLAGIIGAVRLAVGELKREFIAHPLPDAAAEIDLFKCWKPKFVAEQLYAVEVFTIEARLPIGGDEVLVKAYYEQELRFIRRFFDQHRFLYQYYLLDGSELDALYFVRGAEVPVSLLPDGPDLDPEFSTAGDFLFAKFIAYERVQEYLIGCLYHGKENDVPNRSGRKAFKWSGDKSNLIELAYGLYGTMQINEGDVTIAEIVDWLEESFNISLSRYYRRFTEIKMRKSVSRTKYLDEMVEAVIRYIEEGEGWKPKGIKGANRPK